MSNIMVVLGSSLCILGLAILVFIMMSAVTIASDVDDNLEDYMQNIQENYLIRDQEDLIN